MSKAKNVLLAGGAGFIGSHLADRLLAQGCEVTVVDKLVFGRKDNIEHLIGKEGFRFIEQDLADLGKTLELFDSNCFDGVYHLAANSDIQKGGQDPQIDFHDTFLTTHCILEGMRCSGVKRLFFSSTSAVYGEKTGVMLAEDQGDLQPVSYYGGAKLASEALICSYASMLDLQVLVFRFPNVIGPRLTHGVVFDFARKLRNDPKKLEILGNGLQCKQYIYVSDLIEAIAALSADWKDGVSIYNVGVQGPGTTVNRIADIICDASGLSDVQYFYSGGDRGWKGDVPSFEYDISKILATGWRPRYSSDDAVIETVKWAVGCR